MICGLGTAFVPLPSGVLVAARWLAAFIIVLTMSLVVVAVHQSRTSSGKSVSSNVSQEDGAVRFALQIVEGLSKVRPVPDLALGFAYSVGIPPVQGLALWFVMKAFGLDLPLHVGIVVHLIVHLRTALPNAPSNPGTCQLFTVMALQMFGVERAKAASFSLLVFSVLTVPFWVVGSVALLRSGITLIRNRIHQWIPAA